MENHPIESLMKSTMENIQQMVDVNTIVGDAVESKDGSLIIPISRVSFGFVSGGSEFNKSQANADNSKYPFGGASGAGVTIKPVAFLVMKNESIKVLSVDHQNTYDRIVESIPQIIEMYKNKTSNKNNEKESKKDCEENKNTCEDKESQENKE